MKTTFTFILAIILYSLSYAQKGESNIDRTSKNESFRIIDNSNFGGSQNILPSMKSSKNGDIYKVTFLVDVSNACAEGNIWFDPEKHDLYISGTFNDWTMPGTDELFKLQPVEVQTEFFENWEGFDYWTTDLHPWTTYQLTSGETWETHYIDFPGEGTEFAWIIFNPFETTPPIDDTHPPMSGNSYAAAMQYKGLNDNKWLISPKMEITSSSILMFWAISFSHHYGGGERMRVSISISGNEPEDFILISERNYIEVPREWTLYTYDLSEYANHNLFLGFQFVSSDGEMLIIDDITVSDVNFPGNKVYYQITLELPEGVHEYKYYLVENQPTWDIG
ncbi:MAG: choice-of-anchor J domain-containing protein [Bacteroidetes bacterium]|nr:choice-of-anchor J domain-containing protein [Bacteroidota bacterium]